MKLEMPPRAFGAVLAGLAACCWLSTGWSEVRCARGMSSAGSCLLRHKSPGQLPTRWPPPWPPAHPPSSGLLIAFEPKQLSAVEQQPCPAPAAGPLALLAALFVPASTACCELTVETDPPRRIGLAADSAVEAAAVCRQLSQFASGGGRRLVRHQWQFIILPRLLALALALAGLAVGCPAWCAKAVGAVHLRWRWLCVVVLRLPSGPVAFEWDPKMIRRLEQAASQVPKGSSQRWRAVAEKLGGGCTAQMAEFKFKQLQQAAKPKPKPQPRRQRVESSPEDLLVDVPKPVEWSGQDQAALETALKRVSKDEPNRWEMVAQLVPNKSKRECIARCKEIAKRMRSGGAVE